MKLITVIITLLTIVWYVVQLVAQAKERQANEQRAAEARLEQLRKQRLQQQQGGESSRAGESRASSGSDGRSDLAERRRKQIEELRRRRAAQAGGSVSTSTSVRVPSASPGAGPAVGPRAGGQFNMGIAPVPTAQRPKRPSQTTGRSAAGRADALRTRPAQQPRQALTAKAQPTLKSKPTKSKKDRPTESATPVSPHQRSVPLAATGVAAGPIRARLRNRAALREAFILKELLDPPVSMRQ